MRPDEFRRLRDLDGKRIVGEVRFVRRQAGRPALYAENIPILVDGGAPLRMDISFNPDRGSKIVNVCSAEGAICRLCVDGTEHGDAGRSHKHEVIDDSSVRKHLGEGCRPRQELSGKSLKDVVETFCRDAKIDLTGANVVYPPEDE